MTLDSLFENFLTQQALPSSYKKIAEQHFIPLAQRIYEQAMASEQPIIVGINGCQGSGKSTVTDLLTLLLNEYHACPAMGMSIDDFYLTQQQRNQLAEQVHPLFATRGVPGTHNTELMYETLNRLKNSQLPVQIPKFNKAIDNPYPQAQWPLVEQPVKVILFEGWCVAAMPQADSELVEPVNKLEREEDPKAIWRGYANKKLAEEYQQLFSLIDRIVMLKAPGFHTVQAWRLQQEHKLRDRVTKEKGDSSAVMSDEQVERFIQHYQRVTQNCFNQLPEKADELFLMDEQRQIQQSVCR